MHLPFDEARKLVQSCGLDIAETWSRCVAVREQNDLVRPLGLHERRAEELDVPCGLADALHRALLLREQRKRDDRVRTLVVSGYEHSEVFFRVEQAISATLPPKSREKKRLDGFLAGRERLRTVIAQAERTDNDGHWREASSMACSAEGLRAQRDDAESPPTMRPYGLICVQETRLRHADDGDRTHSMRRRIWDMHRTAVPYAGGVHRACSAVQRGTATAIDRRGIVAALRFGKTSGTTGHAIRTSIRPNRRVSGFILIRYHVLPTMISIGRYRTKRKDVARCSHFTPLPFLTTTFSTDV